MLKLKKIKWRKQTPMDRILLTGMSILNDYYNDDCSLNRLIIAWLVKQNLRPSDSLPSYPNIHYYKEQKAV